MRNFDSPLSPERILSGFALWRFRNNGMAVFAENTKQDD
jgi:hypothetical protein